MNKPEKLCKKTMERLFRVKFVKVRPKWLINPKTGRRLELDNYNDDLAVEYNGITHYVHPNWTHQSREDFIKGVERDRVKAEICRKRGIDLITVPHTVPYGLIYDYIIRELDKIGRMEN